MASSDRPRRSQFLAGLAVLALTGALVGCGHHASHATSGLFDNQQQASLSCMAHQGQQPGPLYTAGAQGADTAHVLQMMQYYTSNGSKPYCDGAKPSAIDQAWARLYVLLGGQATMVRTAAGSS
ncbi:MAG: hypothetical protein ACR2N4_09975 [Jatrophihabitans sp.]